MRDIIAACSLPVLMDADDAYGDVKNVTRVVQGYEAMGAHKRFGTCAETATALMPTRLTSG